MNTLDIVLLAVAVALVLVVLVGAMSARRRQDARDARLRERLAAANKALAQAHSDDKGWDRATLEAAARAAAGAVDELHLVQVIDNPGTEADEAVFEVVVAGGERRELRLGRVDDQWVAR